jgi:hypothetical protein
MTPLCGVIHSGIIDTIFEKALAGVEAQGMLFAERSQR